MVSMQSEQLTRMERMLQANLSNTQMAPRTGVHRTEAPPVNRQEAREQLRRARTSGSGPGGPYGPSNLVRGFRSRRSRMKDVDQLVVFVACICHMNMPYVLACGRFKE